MTKQELYKGRKKSMKRYQKKISNELRPNYIKVVLRSKGMPESPEFIELQTNILNIKRQLWQQ